MDSTPSETPVIVAVATADAGNNNTTSSSPDSSNGSPMMSKDDANEKKRDRVNVSDDYITMMWSQARLQSYGKRRRIAIREEIEARILRQREENLKKMAEDVERAKIEKSLSSKLEEEEREAKKRQDEEKIQKLRQQERERIKAMRERVQQENE